MSSIWGGGFIPIANYSSSAITEDHLITQSNIDILTQNSLNILVQSP
jgi:hypothetical protein